MHSPLSRPTIEQVEVGVYTVPTDQEESDGTLVWSSTTVVVVEVSAGGSTGLGFSYTSEAAATLIERALERVVVGGDALGVERSWTALNAAVRNVGRPGIASTAIAAMDIALWDLKARILEVALVDLLGRASDKVPVYGSGGFTSYTHERLQQQFSDWARHGIRAMKMKIGRDTAADPGRVAAAREAIGPGPALFVDANGACSARQAIQLAEAFAAFNVTWFEEPVSSDDLDGLRFVRNHVPGPMEIAAGEYGYDLTYFARMIAAGAVDVLQADATRCAGITGFMKAAALCEAMHVPLSAHTAPSIHAHPCAAVSGIRPLEYFHDHVRIEHLFFDGAATPRNGDLWPDSTRPGLGLEFKRQDAGRYRVR